MTAEQAKVQAEVTAHDNAQIVSVTQDALDATGDALGSKGISNGRYAANREAGRNFDCAAVVSSTFTVDKTHPDSIVYSGSISIDYGTGVSCHDSTEIRKGKITDSFIFVIRYKDSLSYKLTESISFQGYQKDSVQVDGLFVNESTKSSSALKVQNAKITYADGTSVAWNGTLNTNFTRNSQWRGDQSRQVTGSISGTNRSGTSFSAAITKELLYQYSCSKNIPVSGTIDVNVGTVSSVVDFGTGTCDKTYTITTNGQVTTYTFKRHHHV
ncbi:hypothetical protein WSM22_37000 [Cytophagales bacterium WSM2-2]|nr:hypothetical protein WSM22_37000 [Cytophagales bacterium WSM2-2]